VTRNPHFDDGLIIWSDEFSGRYGPPPGGYSEQFDLQWKLHLDGRFQRSADASTDETAIADRIFEWTAGSHDSIPTRASDSVRPLDHPLDLELIRDKDCIDIGCGLGRWTRTMQKLGARSVLSMDMSEHGLTGVRRFNQNVLRADVTEIPSEHPELINQFDFANLWGVAMCTHDPLKTFMSASATVKPGGALYLMVYAPEGMHGSPITNLRRQRFFQLQSLEEKLAYVDRVYHRRWDDAVPLSEKFRNVLRNVTRRPKGSKIGVLDALEPFYNWVIPLDVIHGWMKKAGFETVIQLNEFEPQKCAYHFLGLKKQINHRS
jgi:SAM-dependent methyltransferase